MSSRENFQRKRAHQLSGVDGKKRHTQSLKTEAKWFGFLLLAGVVLGGCCIWGMAYTSHSEAVAHRLGMTRVANSLGNVLDLLALPALLFAFVLVLYALQRLYQLYRQVSYPNRQRDRQNPR